MNRTCVALLLMCTFALSCGNDGGTSPPPTPSDTTPPAAVVNLEVIGQVGSEVTLSWRTPGDDGNIGSARQYDFRYSPDSLTEASWATAPLVDTLPTPQVAGSWVSFTIPGLPLGTWYLAMKTADEVPNWSPLSNVVRATVADVVPPSRVNDLRTTAITRQSATLLWTAPADQGPLGRAVHYDLRRSAIAITEQSWSMAASVEGVPTPSAAGGTDSCRVAGLAEETTYFFALKSTDEGGNVSDLSNLASFSTPSATLHQLTHDIAGGYSAHPTWSPDGSELAFRVGSAGSAEIYRMSVTGGTPVRLTENTASDVLPAWSPDGTRIAFLTDRQGKGELWVMGADGSDPYFVADLEARTLFSSRPAWKPDGTRIVYMVGEGGVTVAPTSLYLVPPNGGTRELLIAGVEWNNTDPAWSPDGSQLAFACSIGMYLHIWVKPMPSGQPYQLTHEEVHQMAPCWSPDGNTIVYSSNQSGDWELWSIPATGGAEVQITSNPADEFHPAFSPDGRRLAFTSTRSGQPEIWIKDLE